MVNQIPTLRRPPTWNYYYRVPSSEGWWWATPPGTSVLCLVRVRLRAGILCGMTIPSGYAPVEGESEGSYFKNWKWWGKAEEVVGEHQIRL